MGGLVHNRRSFSILLALCSSLPLLLATCQGVPPSTSGVSSAGPKLLPTSGPLPEVSGKLLYGKTGGFWTFELSTGAIQQLASFPPRSFAGSPSVSPDGALVAYSMYAPGQDTRDPGGTDLYVMGSDGSNHRLVLAHDSPGVSLGEPAWAPDGRALYFTRRATDGSVRIERARTDGSGREVVVEGGHSPWVSPDGQKLVYLTTAGRSGAGSKGAASAAPTQDLWVASIHGTDPKRLVGEPDFQLLAAPRFAPDSQRIAFVAVPAMGRSPAGRTDHPVGQLLVQVGPGTAYAHGVPWDLWLVNADGTGLRRLTDLEEDSPVPTWSPDGRWIAFSGELGLYLVDAEGRQVRRLAEEPASGIAWLGS